MSSSGQDPRNNTKLPRNSTMHLDPRISQHGDEMPFFDYATEHLEVMSSDLSPPLAVFCSTGDRAGLGRLQTQHATYPNRQPTSSQVHERTAIPAFSYPSAVSTTRGAQVGFSPLSVPPYGSSQLIEDPTATATPTYPPQSAFSHSSTYCQTGIDWHPSPASDSLYLSEDSSVASASLNVNPFGYVSQPNNADPYMGDYVSPAALQDGSVSGSNNLYWTGDGSMMDNMDLGFSLPANNTLSPELGSYESRSWTPEGGLSDSDKGNVPYPDPAQLGQEENLPRRKRAKKSPEKTIPVIPGASSGHPRNPVLVPALVLAPKAGSRSPTNITNPPAVHKSKLRSASRTSKNTVPRQAESPEERKSRNSHNLVEKQYRNRLNAQFEGLLNALPETIRSTGGGSGGDSDGAGGGSGGLADLGGRRLSKAEVLDISRRYIHELERERDKLERERDGLQGDMERLRGAYERGAYERGLEREKEDGGGGGT